MNYTKGCTMCTGAISQWEYDTTGQYYTPGVIRQNGQLIARTVDDTTIPAKERHANGFLIAAAPDMYEALKDALVYCDLGEGSVGIAVKAALAKAEGKPI